MTIIKAALVQMCSGPTVNDNLTALARLLAEQLPKSVDLLVLPECFAGLTDDVTVISRHAKRIRTWMGALAKRHRVWLIGGSIPLPIANTSRCWATCFVYDATGREVTYYHKMHLFDVNVADNIGRYRESDHYQAGNTVKTVTMDKTVLGLSICYDVRFPELYRRLTEQGAVILCVPSAFIYKTGQAHWELLLRARAIENQCFVLAPNQTGVHANGRRTWGHSMIISPWGDSLVQAKQQPAIVMADLDLAQVTTVRQKMPCLQHRLVV